tara:strand:- start:314 stop:1639 length:1326 start_codon:yes stop_codon:yes gene_type:complete
LALTGALPAAAQPANHNILFLVVDDLRTWVGYTGEYPGSSIHGPGVYTPAIDALAAASTRYLNAYTTVPTCAASRTSVMFGLSPATHGLTASAANFTPEYAALYADESLVTIPQVMSANGYHAAAAGKVFHSQLPARWDETGPPIDYGSFYDPFDPGPDNTWIVPEVLPEGELHPDQAVADWGANFIQGYAQSVAGIEGQPFFLALGFYQPHLPWRVPQAYYDLYPLEDVVAPSAIPGDLDDVPAAGVDYANAPFIFGLVPQYDAIEAAGVATEYTRAYLASISHTDAMVSQVLAALAASPYASNTSVVFFSDHGYHLGEKFHWRKNTLWEQSARVPLLVSSPGNPDYPVGDVTEEVSLLDIAATVLDLAGLPPETQFTGAPLHDALNRSPVEIYLGTGVAQVDAGIKRIDYDTSVSGAGDKERYDLSSDPQEVANLIPGC